VSQLTQLPKDKLRCEVDPRCCFEADSVHIVHLLVLVIPRPDIHLLWMDPYPPVRTRSRRHRRNLQAIVHAKINTHRATKGSTVGILLDPGVYAPSITRNPLRTNSFRVFGRGKAASRGLDDSDVASANVQDGGNPFGPNTVAISTVRRRCACWGGCCVRGGVWAAKRHVSPAYDEACTHKK
jgi:hypothetical protein